MQDKKKRWNDWEQQIEEEERRRREQRQQQQQQTSPTVSSIAFFQNKVEKGALPFLYLINEYIL